MVEREEQAEERYRRMIMETEEILGELERRRMGRRSMQSQAQIR